MIMVFSLFKLKTNILILKLSFRNIFFFLCILFFIQKLNAQEDVLVLKDSLREMSLNDYIEILEDPRGKLSIRDIKSPKYQLLFEKNVEASPAVQAYWIRLRVQNQLNKENDWLLEFAPWNYVMLFYEDPSNGADSVRETGAMVAMPKRDVKLSLANKNVFLRLPLSNKVKSTYQTIYIRVEGFAYFQPSLIPTLHSKYHILKSNRKQKYFQGVYIGIILVMALYNLMIFFSVRDKSYFYYVLYLFFLGFIFIIDSGDGLELIWSNFPLINQYIPFYAYALVLIFNTLFTKNYLNASINAPLGNKLLSIFISIIAVLSIIVFMIQIEVYYFIFYVLVVLTIIINTSVAISCIKIGFRPAKYYLIANINLFLGLLFAIVYIYFQKYWEAHTAVQIGSALEAIVFSLGLADRINSLKKEKETAREMSILQLQENERLKDKVNKELEEKVVQRTERIEKQKKEISKQQKFLAEQNRALERANESIIKQTSALQKSNVKLTDSIRYAETIQKALLPQNTDFNSSFDEYFVIFIPKDIVSGDFYWYNKIQDKTFFLVADATGHGVPAGFISTIAISQLNEIVIHQKIYEPEQIFKQLHQRLISLLRQEEKQNEDAIDIALCIFEENFYSAEVKVTFMGAKRHLWFIKNYENTLKEIRGERFSLGGGIGTHKPKPKFNTHKVTLHKGDILYLMSDGFIDQNSPENKKFGSRKLKKLLETVANKSLQEQEQTLLENLKKHQKESTQRDDITLIGVRI